MLYYLFVDHRRRGDGVANNDGIADADANAILVANTNADTVGFTDADSNSEQHPGVDAVSDAIANS